VSPESKAAWDSPRHTLATRTPTSPGGNGTKRGKLSPLPHTYSLPSSGASSGTPSAHPSCNGPREKGVAGRKEGEESRRSIARKNAPVAAAVVSQPQAAHLTRHRTRASTARGSASSLLLPWPSLPNAPLPHVKSVPPSVEEAVVEKNRLEKEEKRNLRWRRSGRGALQSGPAQGTPPSNLGPPRLLPALVTQLPPARHDRPRPSVFLLPALVTQLPPARHCRPSGATKHHTAFSGNQEKMN